MNFTFNHFEGLWKVKRNISPNTCASGLAHIIKNKNSELVFKEKFLTNLDKKNIIFGENQYLIEIKNKKLHFIFIFVKIPVFWLFLLHLYAWSIL